MMTQPFLLEKMEVKFNKTELKCVNLPRKYHVRVFNYGVQFKGNI